MALRKARAYSKKRVVPYTRTSKKKSKSFIKTLPQQKIVKFTMGNSELYKHGRLLHELTLVSMEKAQIRHNAFEACRQYINKKLDKEFLGRYFFRVIVFPHHVQRENRMLTTPGADRMQTGMQLSFGKAIGKAAIVKPGSKIFLVALSNQKAANFARKVLNQIKSKLPCKTKVVYEVREK